MSPLCFMIAGTEFVKPPVVEVIKALETICAVYLHVEPVYRPTILCTIQSVVRKLNTVTLTTSPSTMNEAHDKATNVFSCCGTRTLEHAVLLECFDQSQALFHFEMPIHNSLLALYTQFFDTFLRSCCSYIRCHSRQGRTFDCMKANSSDAVDADAA